MRDIGARLVGAKRLSGNMERKRNIAEKESGTESKGAEGGRSPKYVTLYRYPEGW